MIKVYKGNKLIIAKSYFLKLLGLYFRKNNTCVLLKKCNDIHTFFFFRKIDVAFIDKSGFVIKVVKNLRPWKRISCKEADDVFECFSKSDCFEIFHKNKLLKFNKEV